MFSYKHMISVNFSKRFNQQQFILDVIEMAAISDTSGRHFGLNCLKSHH